MLNRCDIKTENLNMELGIYLCYFSSAQHGIHCSVFPSGDFPK